ncbi:hypothetical protein THRCLA_01865 [Thraustotheca clavata]|uniref:Uncharacterized protein n=1 Tax=Thraustotheca clavata TaxID=74557 RepID=A0A1W0A7A2_9STRA|nr:hypothetical protein THRCLA_01865 [Thraustotheca clavata]
MDEEVVWEYHNALLLVDGDSLRLTAPGVAFLSSFNHPIATVVITGGSKRLNLASRALLDNQVKEATQPGIYCIANADFMQSGRCVLLLDVQLPSWPSPLRAIAASIASLLIVADYDDATMIAQMIHGLKEDNEDIEEFLPTLAWISDGNTMNFQPRTWPQIEDINLDAALALAKHVGQFTLPDQATSAYRNRLYLYALEKRVYGTSFTGNMMVSFIDGCLTPTSDGAIDLLAAWDQVVRLECEPIAAEALQTYRDAMDDVVTEGPPMELSGLQKLHSDVEAMAFSLYSSRATFKHAPARRQVKEKLKQNITELYDAQTNQLLAYSFSYCSKIRDELLQVHLQASQESIAEALNGFIQAYRAQAQGPKKEEILSDCLGTKGVAYLVEVNKRAYMSWTEEQLSDERKQLHEEYRAKQEKLVEHFTLQKDQLEERVRQEQTLWQKAQIATQARSNMDATEHKRLREDLSSAQRAILELQEENRRLQNTISEWQSKCQNLQDQVVAKENALQEEALVRSSLVDRLSEAIQQEQTIASKYEHQIAQVVNTSQAKDNQLRETQAQLHTVSEEKEMLQRKLNEFFLKASALPPVIQEHLICVESDTIEFADALSSFMST